MVLIDETKYACETCIKGHRSSTCKHTDRPLFEIKKKGRPITQCEHCRELRKTKQIHVKCICETKEDTIAGPSASGSHKKGTPKLPDVPAFPRGLPRAPGSSAAPSSGPDGSSSDSDRGGGCTCKAGDECHCWTPRKSVPRVRRKAKEKQAVRDGSGGSGSPAPSATPSRDVNALMSPSQTPAHILARIAALRPVRPRPTHADSEPAFSHHDPSSRVAHGHSSRQTTHENTLFSPYGRAYAQQDAMIDPALGQVGEAEFPDQQLFFEQLQASADDIAWPPPRDYLEQSFGGGSFPSISICGCGDSCQCPGCPDHDTSSNAIANFSTCVNPGACAGCLECSLMTLSSTIPDTGPMGGYYQEQAMNDWANQVPPFADPSQAHMPWGPPPGNFSNTRPPPGPSRRLNAASDPLPGSPAPPFAGMYRSNIPFTDNSSPFDLADLLAAQQTSIISAGDDGYLTPPDAQSRSRSGSTSSQSSVGVSDAARMELFRGVVSSIVPLGGAPPDRVQVPSHLRFNSTPNLGSLIQRPSSLGASSSSSSSVSMSPPPPVYARSNPDMDMDRTSDYDNTYLPYDPSFDFTKLY